MEDYSPMSQQPFFSNSSLDPSKSKQRACSRFNPCKFLFYTMIFNIFTGTENATKDLQGHTVLK